MTDRIVLKYSLRVDVSISPYRTFFSLSILRLLGIYKFKKLKLSYLFGESIPLS